MAKSLNTLANMVDEYHLLREKRLAAQKEVDAMEAEERELREALIASIDKSDASGVGEFVAVKLSLTKL